jgi:UDP-N-acetylglucosamine--dolichyl-phosphate N-acetylglucosaminephosphotransferase
MGGLTILSGTIAGILLAVALFTFFNIWNLSLKELFAAMCTILIMAIIGIFDDLFDLKHFPKMLLPLFAALPLAAISAGTTSMNIPFIGVIDFGVFYALVLIPIAITGCSNITNMLAGFNGMEAGMGILACGSLSIIALYSGNTTSAVILISTLFALAAFLKYNWYPSKIFIGDCGNLSIGAIIAASVIIGNFESFGVIVMIPYIADFFIKAVNKFPSRGWGGVYNPSDNKLYVPEGKNPLSLCQWIMKIFNGISEKNLTLTLIAMEAVFAIIALAVYFFHF